LHFKTDLGSGLWGLKGCVCLQGTLGEKGERGEPGDNGYQVSVSVFHTLKKKTFLFAN